MLTTYIVLEGFNIGAGMLQYVVGKTEAERRMVIAALGPVWSWHEVWLIGFGGTLLMAFPALMAASFSGFYLALILLLWTMVLRGVSIELSGEMDDPLWRAAWHSCFVASNIVIAILVGAALGNVLRGVPVTGEGTFALPFFTNFRPSGDVGILDWYTMSVAVFFLATVAAHGAAGLARRTDGPVHARSLEMARMLWKIVLALLVVVILETLWVRFQVFSLTLRRPLGWMGVICVAVGIRSILGGIKEKRESRLLRGSTAFIVGLMIVGTNGVFPSVLRSTIAPEYSLSAYATAADRHGLTIALVWWPISLLFAVTYFLFLYRFFYSSRLKPAPDAERLRTGSVSTRPLLRK